MRYQREQVGRPSTGSDSVEYWVELPLRTTLEQELLRRAGSREAGIQIAKDVRGRKGADIATLYLGPDFLCFVMEIEVNHFGILRTYNVAEGFEQINATGEAMRQSACARCSMLK